MNKFKQPSTSGLVYLLQNLKHIMYKSERNDVTGKGNKTRDVPIDIHSKKIYIYIDNVTIIQNDI